MLIEDKVFYNKSTSDSLGWKPEWFGHNIIDEVLIKKVKQWQKNNDLKPDGLVGPMTYRRIWTYVNSKEGFSKHKVTERSDNHIVCNGEKIPINWDKVVLWNQPGGLKSKIGTYYSYSGKKRKPNLFVNHWDVCLSAEKCARVLNKRGISVHFCLDNDGTIYQLLDTNHAAWHAGSVNRKSIGVEISNAYYLKYQSWYVKNGFGERPIIKDAVCHGKKMKPFLGFYDVQLEALKQLWLSIHDAYDIPLTAPKGGSGSFKTSTEYSPKIGRGSYSGFVSHYHQSKRKIDCAGLDIVAMLDELE